MGIQPTLLLHERRGMYKYLPDGADEGLLHVAQTALLPGEGKFVIYVITT
jgi:hypothetical protein